jgi:alginate O-acetyltransferase complex protein AlgI
MVFSSLVFLFVFLPLVLLLYYVCPVRGRNFILLVASLVFYTWGEMGYVVVMLVSIIANYCFGIALGKTVTPQLRKMALMGAVAVNLSLLFHYKYFGFFLENLTRLWGGSIPSGIVPDHLPIGISFFTFQALSYVVDCYRNPSLTQANPLHLGLYIASFPQLIAGPIVRYHDVARQLCSRGHSCRLFASGVERFIFGLGKKVLLANPLGEMADHIFAVPVAGLSMPEAWLGVVCYSLQIYFDFSGYSDMAIGLGRMFGFSFLENFNYPYVSKSMQEFWRRWHISLSRWFRDYLYIPLGGNRHGPLATGRNLLLVFLLCGLWHGASWNFVIWGFIHGAFLVLERVGWGRILERLPGIFRHFYVLLVVSIGWVFFRTSNPGEALTYLQKMFIPSSEIAVHPWVINRMDDQIVILILTGMLLSMPCYPFLRKRLAAVWQLRVPAVSGSLAMDSLWIAHLMALLVLAVMSLASGAYNPFIYFRF